MHWKNWPRWLKDTCSVVGAMSALLIIYDAFFAAKVVWWQVPLQILAAFLAVGLWSYYSYRAQAKRQRAAQERALAEQKRAQELAEQQRLAAQRATEMARKNRQRNQQHRQAEGTSHDN